MYICNFLLLTFSMTSSYYNNQVIFVYFIQHMVTYLKIWQKFVAAGTQGPESQETQVCMSLITIYYKINL